MTIDLRVGDCLDVFGAEPDASFDAFVSDWPAGVAFMGRAWDTAHGGRDAWVRVWAERAAVMRQKSKPGAYSLTWALPRTAHWTACALDDAGWQIQDVIVHVFGQGWPKGRSALKPASEHWILARNGSGGALQIDAARVARGGGVPKPSTVRAHRSMIGANDDRTLVPAPDSSPLGSWPPNFALSHCPECEERGVRRVGSQARLREESVSGAAIGYGKSNGVGNVKKTPGLGDDGWERDVAFDCLAVCDCGASVLAPSGGEPPRCACGAAMWWACPVAEMDAQSGERPSGIAVTRNGGGGIMFGGLNPAAKGFASPTPDSGYTDTGGASRFFPRFQYAAKAAGGERHAGCDDLYWKADRRNPFGFSRVTREEWEAIDAAPRKKQIESLEPVGRARGNVHATVKGLALMEWLIALVTPPGGRCGDVTMGSGGTALAAARLNAMAALQGHAPMTFLGCDICPEAVEIARARLAWWQSVRHDVRPVKREQGNGEPPQRSLFAGLT